MKSTIRDVAEKAGVSAMAVSKVLHGKGQNVRVSPQKAELIRQAAAELNYKPNQNARNFRNQKTNLIGVVFQHFEGIGEDSPYLPALLDGILNALLPAGYTLGICPQLAKEGDTAVIADGRFDGVIWARPDLHDKTLPPVASSPVPIVVLHAPPGTVPGIPTFVADNEAAVEAAVDHLYDLGHRKIAFAIDVIPAETLEGTARFEAFERSMRARDLVPVQIIENEAEIDPHAYLAHTAIVCFSDAHAGRILKAAEAHGISIPRDLSVIGFDSTSYCERTRPRLTSVKQPVEQMARDATSLLLKMVDGTVNRSEIEDHLVHQYECPLDVRDSTAPPRD